jgi:hypothetical protein
MTAVLPPRLIFDTRYTTPVSPDRDSEGHDFTIASQNFDQMFGRNHVSGNEGPQTAAQEAMGGSESYGARLQQLQQASWQSGHAARQVLVLLQSMESTLLQWRQQLEPYADLTQGQLPAVGRPLLAPLPDGVIFVAWMQRYQASLSTLHAALALSAGFPAVGEVYPAELQNSLHQTLLVMHYISRVLMVLSPPGSEAAVSMRAPGTEQDGLQMMESVEIARMDSQVLLLLVGRYQQFYQDCSR